MARFAAGETGEKVEPGVRFDFIYGNAVIVERGRGRLIGNDGGEHGPDAAPQYENHFEDVCWYGDVAGSDHFDFGRGEYRAREDEDGIGASGEFADRRFQLAQTPRVDRLALRHSVGEQISGAERLERPGGIGGGNQVTSRVTTAGVVRIAGDRPAEGGVLAELRRLGQTVRPQAARVELIDGPGREFAGGIVADEEEGTDGEFLMRSRASGQR